MDSFGSLAITVSSSTSTAERADSDSVQTARYQVLHALWSLRAGRQDLHVDDVLVSSSFRTWLDTSC